jgi:hypothetical protein
MELRALTGLIGYYEGTRQAQAGLQETEQNVLGGPKLRARIWTSSRFLPHLVKHGMIYIIRSCFTS